MCCNIFPLLFTLGNFLVAAKGKEWLSGARLLGWHSGLHPDPKGKPTLEQLQLRFSRIFPNKQLHPTSGAKQRACSRLEKTGRTFPGGEGAHPAGIVFFLGPGAELHSQLVPVLPWTLGPSFPATSSCCSQHKTCTPQCSPAPILGNSAAKGGCAVLAHQTP